MFRSSIGPAIVFFLVAMVVSESPRWLFRRGARRRRWRCCSKRDRAQADLEMREMEAVTGAARERRQAAATPCSNGITSCR